MIKKEPGKFLQYKHLSRGIQCMFSIKAVIPLIIGVIGTISKTIRSLLLLLLLLLVVVVVVAAAEIVLVITIA